MKKFTVNDAAAYFGVSKEAIHNRVRRGSLQSVIENGVKLVIVDETKQVKTTRTPRSTGSSTDKDRYYRLLEEQNAKLQSRVEVLEDETRSLRDQKELMLIEERKKIERIYKEKDEQLKNILNTISSQFALSAPETLDEQEEAFEAEIEEPTLEVVDAPSKISLKEFLKLNGFSKKKREKIKERFKKGVKKDKRIISIKGKLYLNPSLYDYSDLL